MIWIISLLFLFSGVGAYFVIKTNIRYLYKIFINCCIIIISWLCLFLSNISELSILSIMAFSFLTFLGIIFHFITPLTLNFVGKFLSKLTQQSFSSKTYNELLNDGHRMYFCILLFTTLKIFSLSIFIISALNMMK